MELQTECDRLCKEVELNENGLTEALEQKKTTFRWNNNLQGNDFKAAVG